MNTGEGYTYFHYYICNLLATLRVSINIPSENADTSNEKEDAPKRPSRLKLMGKLIGL
jgi:hypothetical protein